MGVGGGARAARGPQGHEVEPIWRGGRGARDGRERETGITISIIFKLVCVSFTPINIYGTS